MPFKLGRRERSIAGYLKFVGHVRPDVVLMDDGSVFGMLSVDGLSWDTAEIDDIRRWNEDLNLSFRNIAFDNLTIMTYQCRGAAHPSIYPDRKFPSEFVTRLNERYRERLFEQTLYSNRIFIGILVRPARYMGDFMSEQVAKRSKPAEDAPEDRLRRLDDTCSLLQGRLSAYGLQRLGLRETKSGLFSEIAESLVFAVTGIWRPIALCTGRMANAMFSEKLIFGREAIEIRTPGWSSYAAMFGIREYPASTYPGMFDTLSRARYFCTVFQSFRFLAKATAETIMNRKQNFMVGAEDKAFEQLGELRQAGNDLMSNKFVIGDHSLSFIVFADSMQAMRSVATEAWRNLSEGGAVVAREGAALEAAFFSMMPGNDKLRPRPGYISSRNLSSMAPMRNSPQGPARGHWGGPIAILRNSDGSAHRFHWHVDDVGNTLITGETGSGKAQPLDAKVLTPTGFRPMGSLKMGDLVTCPDGSFAPVVGIYPQGEKEIFRVTFEDGRSVECCDDHLWKVWEHKNTYEKGRTHATRRVLKGDRWSVQPLSEIRAWFAQGKMKAKRAAVPLVRPSAIELPPQSLPVPPYALGALLGDGSTVSGAAQLTSADPHISERCLSDLPVYEGAPTSCALTTRLHLRNLRDNPVLATQDAVKRNAALLQGVFDIQLGEDNQPRIRTVRRGTYANPTVICHRGITRSVTQWANAIGISPQLLRARLAKWSLDEALGFVPRPHRVDCTRSPLVKHLRDLGLFGKRAWEKFVPEIYKRGSVAQRTAVLQGLMDTDGSVGNGTHATFTSTSEQLAKDVQELAWSLGAIASIAPRQTYFTYRGKQTPGRPSWRVSIVHPDVSMFFSLPRKLAECKKKTMRHRLRITSIESIGQKPAQCIAIDHPDHLYVTDNYVVTHNSLTAAFLLAMSTGRAGMIMIDYKRGWELFTRSIDGDYAVLGDGKPHMAPLKALNPTPDNLRFLSDLIHGCIGQQMTSEEERRLALGLKIVMAQPPEDRSLGEIRAFLGMDPNGAGAALERWCWGNDLGWVIDAPENTVNLHGGVHGYDMTAILDNPRARGPTLYTLFHYIWIKLQEGRPIIIPNDEGWKALLDAQFRPMIERIIRTIRAYGGIFVFLTQGPGELKKSEIGSVLVEQCPTQIRLPVDRATWEDYRDVLKSTQGEWEAFRELRKGSGMMLLCQGGTSAVVELPLKGMEDEIAILSARQSTLNVWDAVRDENADAPTHKLLEETQERRRIADARIRELVE